MIGLAAANRCRRTQMCAPGRPGGAASAHRPGWLAAAHRRQVLVPARSALEAARASAPEVVPCDLGLPGMSGYDVAQSLRVDGRQIQLFAVPGYAQPEDVRRAIAAGFDGHVAKPPDLDALERLLA